MTQIEYKDMINGEYYLAYMASVNCVVLGPYVGYDNEGPAFWHHTKANREFTMIYNKELVDCNTWHYMHEDKCDFFALTNDEIGMHFALDS